MPRPRARPASRSSTGSSAADLVAGSVTLVGGEPGIGKSTLLLQAAIAMAGLGLRCLLVCAEESAQQVKRRAARLGPLPAGVWVVAETSLAGVLAAVDEVAPDVLVVDSIQTVFDSDVESGPGSVTQVRACALSLVRYRSRSAWPRSWSDT